MSSRRGRARAHRRCQGGVAAAGLTWSTAPITARVTARSPSGATDFWFRYGADATSEPGTW